MRLGGISPERLDVCGAVGADVDLLARRYALLLEQAKLIDIPDLYRLAAAAVSGTDPVGVPLEVPVLLLDVPVRDEATRELVGALASRAVCLVATVPAGDDRTRTALGGLPRVTVESVDEPLSSTDPLAQVRASAVRDNRARRGAPAGCR